MTTFLLIVLIAMVAVLLFRDMRRTQRAKAAYKILSQRIDAMANKQQLDDAQKDSVNALGGLNQSIAAAQVRVADQQIPDAAIETQQQITQSIQSAKAAVDAILPAAAPATPASAKPTP